MSLDRIDAETLGRTAAHQGMTEAQIEAVMTSLGVTPGSNLIHRALRTYRLRLEWINRGYMTEAEQQEIARANDRA